MPCRDVNIRKYLDLSALHLPYSEFEELSAAPTVVREHEYGAFVYVAEDDESTAAAFAEEGFPVLWAVLSHARSLGCAWVNIDVDGPDDTSRTLDYHESTWPGNEHLSTEENAS